MSLIGGLLRLQASSYNPEKRRIAGHVLVNGIGSSRRVVVYNRTTAGYISSTSSKSDGSWEIRGLPVCPERSLTAIAFDDTGAFNAEVLDFLSQVE